MGIWFTLLIACSILLAVITVLAVIEVMQEEEEREWKKDTQDTLDINESFRFDNHVIISTQRTILKNEDTPYARTLLISSLLTNEHDSIKQYKPVHVYSAGRDITDRFEYHSLIEAKTLAIAIRLMLVNNTPDYLHVDQLIVKSEEYKDLFILNPEEFEIQPYQRIYIIWYIQVAGDNMTEAGISQLLQGLAYGRGTQYKHALLKDIVLMDGEGSVLPFYQLHYRVEDPNSNSNVNSNSNANTTANANANADSYDNSSTATNTITNSITATAILKNNTAKDLRIKTIAIRNTSGEYIFAYDLEEELEVKAYGRITVKVSIWS